MRFLISSGSGVDEVCRALWHFLKWLEKRYDFEVVDIVSANCPNCYKSVIIKSSDERLLLLEGVLMWQSVSPFRPKHKRKNWFFEFRQIKSDKANKFLEDKVIYQVMRSPKKGGQNVNKRSSGVRVVYKDLDPKTTQIKEVMSKNLVTLNQGVELFEALEVMKDKALRRYPIVNTENELSGFFSLDDVLYLLGLEMSAVARIIEP